MVSLFLLLVSTIFPFFVSCVIIMINRQSYTCNFGNNYTQIALNIYTNYTLSYAPFVIMLFAFIIAPTVTRVQESSTVQQPGIDLSLSCDFTGFPIPVLTWSYNSTTINPSVEDAVTIVTSNSRSRLTVSGVTEQSRGVYRCAANNSLGNSSQDFTVQCKTFTCMHGTY